MKKNKPTKQDEKSEAQGYFILSFVMLCFAISVFFGPEITLYLRSHQGVIIEIFQKITVWVQKQF